MDKKLASITPANHSKAKASQIEEVTAVEQEAPKVIEVTKDIEELTCSALSIIPVFEDGYRLLALVEVKFNPLTGKAGELKELARDSREEIIDKFKNSVIEKGFFG